MPKSVYVLKIGRDELPDLLAVDNSSAFERVGLDRSIFDGLAGNDLVVGYWANPDGDPLPDFFVSEDEGFADSAAWMSAFLTGVAPLSQWCRHWRRSEFLEAIDLPDGPTLGRRLGAWTGVILAQFSVYNPQTTLKEANAASVLTMPSYAVARGVSVWSNFDKADMLVDRATIVNFRHRDIGQRDNHEHLLALWYGLSGSQWRGKSPANARSLELMRRLLDDLASISVVGTDDIVDCARKLAQHVNLSEVSNCAIGPQSHRVEALDKLAIRLLDGPASVATSAIMGFGASLVDPGAAVMPELLRHYTKSFPSAVLWAGAFAGMWNPVRVLSDHGGIGRIIAKELLRPSDLFSKPASDISFDELHRWTGGDFTRHTHARGVMPRTLLVELFPGISVPLPVTRTDGVRAETLKTTAQQASLNLETGTQLRTDRQRPQATNRSDRELTARVERLERALNELSELSKPSRAKSTKRS